MRPCASGRRQILHRVWNGAKSVNLTPIRCINGFRRSMRLKPLVHQPYIRMRSVAVEVRGMLARLLAVRHADEDIRRRGRNVIILSLGMIVLVMLAATVGLFQPGWELTLAAAAISVAVLSAML